MLTKKCFLLPCLLLIAAQSYGQSTISFSFDSLSNSAKCSPLNVLLKNNSSVGDTFKWSIHLRNSYSNNIEIWSKKDLKYTFGGGTYEIRLSAYDTNMTYLGEAFSEYEVNGAPSTIQMLTSACPGDRVEFSSGIDNKDGPENSSHFWWNFGDGGTSIMPDPKHSYLTAGSYTVKMIMLTDECGYDTVTEAISISTTNTPYGDIELKDAWNGVCPNQEVFFESRQSLQSFTYSWNFGNGLTSTLQEPNSTYISGGNYTVSLTLTNACGKTTTLTDTAKVKTNLRIETNFNLDITPQTVCIGDEVYFNFDKYDNQHGILWNFGDGDSSKLQTVEHVYTALGTYPITLKITNSCNIDSVIKDTILVSTGVSPKGYQLELMLSDSVCPGDNGLYFARADMIPASNITWNFGDGILDTGAIVYHTYASNGTYILKTTFKNGCNLDSVYKDTITVLNNAPANEFSKFFGVASNFACPGDSLVFYSVKSNNFSWDFGDGFTVNAPTTVLEPLNFFTLNVVHHSYAAAGTYIAKYSYSSCGKTYVDSMQIDVSSSEPVKAEFVTEKNIDDKDIIMALPCEPIKFLTFGGAYYVWDFGDGTTDTTSSTVLYHTYTIAGTYTITLKTVNGCGNYAITSETISISGTTQSNTLNLTFETTNASCNGGSNAILKALVTGGSNEYSYKWNTGSTTNLISNLGTGIYIVTVTDLTGCAASTVTGSASVTEPTALTISTAGINVLCKAQCTGEASVTATGGTSPYTYNWSNGSTSQNLNSLCAGTYTVTITDKNGCKANSAITITEPQALAISFNIVNDDCADISGEIKATVSGGTGPFTYFWSNGDTTQLASNLSAGTYMITLVDINSCVEISSATVTSKQPLMVYTSSNDILCNGKSDGSAKASVAGGQSPYQYYWYNGVASSTISGLSSGNYFVSVTDVNNCYQLDTINISEPSTLSSSATGTNLMCNGDFSGSVSVSANGGTLPYYFSWSNGLDSVYIEDLSAGAYTVTVSDDNGCEVINTVSVTEPQAISINLNIINDYCGNNSGEIKAIVTGGTPSYSYSWSLNSTSETASNITAGTYLVTVVDLNLCSKMAVATLTANQPLMVYTSSNDILCNGKSDGSAKASVAGGQSPYQYFWSNGNAASSISGLTSGNYFVSVSDVNNCYNLGSISISEPIAALTASSTGTNLICNGDKSGSASVTVSGGTTPYNYKWSNGGSGSTIVNIAAGNYSVIVTDNNGCLANNSVTLTEPTVISLSVTSSAANCGNSDGQATVNASGGTPAYTYKWTNGKTTQAVTSLASGTYKVTVKDANGCEKVGAAAVGDNQGPTVSITSMSVSCTGGNDGTATVNISGGIAPYTILWDDPAGQTTNTAVGLFAKDYTVQVTDASSCKGGATVKITEPTPVILSLQSTDAVCHGESSGSINLSVSGGTSPYSYYWSNGQKTEDINVLAAGYYSVIVTDAKGCKINDTAWVGEAPPVYISFDFSGSTKTITFSNMSDSTLTGWFWDFADGNYSSLKDPVHVYTDAGYYYVCLNGVSDKGCQSTECLYVEAKDPLVAICASYFDYDTTGPLTLAFYDSSLGNLDTWFWEFGDGSVSKDINPTHTYSNAGYYGICLTVGNSTTGCMATYCQNIKVEDATGQDSTSCFTVADFSFFPDTANMVSFSNKSIGYNSTYWAFGDGYVSVDNNTYHQYLKSGIYEVCLTVFDNATGCMNAICKYVKIADQNDSTACFTKAHFTFIPDTANVVNFKNKSLYYSESFWDFSDGSVSTENSPAHTFPGGGFYNVCLTVKDSSNCIASECVLVEVVDTTQIICKAIYNYVQDISTNTVTFKDKSKGTVSSWFWDLGDGYAAMIQNPSHTYSKKGFYNVCLTMFDKVNGCMDTYCELIQVGGDSALTAGCRADFSFFPVSNYTLSFKDASGGSYNRIYWEFGDGTNSNQLEPQHTFMGTGFFDVCLTVFDDVDSCMNTSCKTIQISDSSSTNCNSFFNFFLDSTGNTVTFKDKSLGNPDYWYWNFNDFTVASNEQSPSHTFADGGYYNVCLTIYKGTDCQNTYCKVIAVGDVSGDVYADFTYFADSLTSSAYFNNQSLGVINGWDWDFGDSQVSSFENPVHTYPDTGNYLVCLTVKNTNNVTGTKCKYIRIGNALENACKFSCVWPGDANYSLEANHYDLLSIGLNYGLSGPTRDSVSTRWIGHYGTDWSTRMPNGINNKHSDCNGDGVVDLADLDAIKQNFAYSHPYQPGKTSRTYNKSNPDLYFEITDEDIAPGSTVEVAIMAGRDSIALYGIGFEVKIDMDKVKQNSVSNSYADSWLGNQSTELITYDKADYNLGEVFVGMTRFNQAEQKGLGSISKLTFTIDSTFADSDEIVICVNTDYGMDANGDTIAFNSGFCDTLKKATGIDEFFKSQKINIYPNPTKGTIIFNLPILNNDEYDFVLINNLGQEVFRSNLGNGGRKEMELNQFGDGLYFVQIISNKRSYYQKLNLVK